MVYHIVAIVGSGTMGAGIAQICALNGIKTILTDISQEQIDQAKKTIEKSLERFVTKGRIDETQKKQALHQITFTTQFEEVSNAEIIIEAIVEIEDIKKELLKKIEQIAKPSALIGSNTSSISINNLASVLNKPERFMGVHFFNPVPIMKLVELVKGKYTSQETYEKFCSFVLQLHKDPATVQDAPGFISNRILMPMINEAILVLDQGIATKEDIDKVMQLGMAHPMGPLTLADLIGLDVCLDIMNVLYKGFGNEKYKAATLLERKVQKGELGRKTGKGFYEYKK